MSLKKYIALLLVGILILSILPLAAVGAAQTIEGEETVPVEEPVQEKREIPWGVTAAFLALVVTLFQNKFIHGRR